MSSGTLRSDIVGMMMNKIQRQFIMRGKQPPLDREVDRAALALNLKLKGAKWKDISMVYRPAQRAKGSPVSRCGRA